jgi:hypothetical protein
VPKVADLACNCDAINVCDDESGCTKEVEGCTKEVEGCTKKTKGRSTKKEQSSDVDRNRVCAILLDAA